jgi:uncharacterized protein involved in type VI secretion and phage assembly
MFGVITGVVIDNKDPEGMGRVRVEFPGDAEEPPKSSWCRVSTPMAGGDRGLVMIPDVDAEVAIGFLGRSASPVVLGCLFNGAADKPPYANDDGDNNLRLLLTNADHQLLFDDTAGAELIGIGAKAASVGDVTSGCVHQVMDDAGAKLIQSSGGDVEYEATGKISIKCTDFEVSASGSVTIEATGTSKLSGASTTVEGKGSVSVSAPMISIGP